MQCLQVTILTNHSCSLTCKSVSSNYKITLSAWFGVVISDPLIHILAVFACLSCAFPCIYFPLWPPDKYTTVCHNRPKNCCTTQLGTKCIPICLEVTTFYLLIRSKEVGITRLLEVSPFNISKHCWNSQRWSYEPAEKHLFNQFYRRFGDVQIFKHAQKEFYWKRRPLQWKL